MDQMSYQQLLQELPLLPQLNTTNWGYVLLEVESHYEPNPGWP